MVMRIWILILIAVFQHSGAQSIINVADDFTIPETTKVPFGKKILLKGNADKNILSIKVTWMFGINEGSKEGTLSNGTWSVIMGPFPISESVIIQFRIVRSISKDTLRKYVNATLGKFAVSMAEEQINLTDAELSIYVKTVLMQSTSLEYNKIKTPGGVSLYDLIVNSICNRLAADQREFVNALWLKKGSHDEIQGLQKRIISLLQSPEYDSLQRNTKKYSPKDTVLMHAFVESISKDSLTGSNAAAFKDVLLKSSITNSQKQYIEGLSIRISELLIHYSKLNASTEVIKSVITENIENTVNDLQLINEYSSSFESSVTVSDIEYYAGFDFGYFMIADRNIYPFFTINIYPNKTEINKDPDNLKERLSLSTGFALKASDIPSNGPAYLLGLGVRINKLFRITIGTAFYQDVNTKKINGEFTAGLSLNFRYVTDLLQIANGATANYPSE